MTIQAGNIGIARLQVLMLPSSPFNGIPEQEWSYYLTADNLPSMGVPGSDIAALPAPFNGYRIIENLTNYDNYLMDIGENYLEDFDSASSRRVQISNDAHGKPSGAQRNFFTWQVAQNFFNSNDDSAAASTGSPSDTPASTTKSVPNPPPKSFKDAQAQPSSNIPTWSYVPKTTPNSVIANTVTPFMNKVMSDSSSPVHWGCKMKNGLALNQPFEMLFYHDGQVHAIADNAPTLDLRFKGDLGFPPDPGKKTFDLSKRAYFAIEIGIGNSKHHYLLLFVQGKSPRSYVIGPAGLGFLNEFTEFDGAKLFNIDNTFFNCKIEPVGNGLMVTSTQFDGKVWAITGTSADPIFVGQGPLAVYSGNIQAGFAMRPLQYKSSGEFITPANTIVQAGGDDRQPICTTAIKGVGDDATKAASGATSTGQVHAADAEKINGQAGKCFFDYLSGEPDLVGGSRSITCTIQQVPDPNTDPAAQDAAQGPNTSAILRKTYAIDVMMRATDLQQPGSGFVVKNGRSPYIWQIRANLAQVDKGGSPNAGIDISCDVLSCDMARNASSFNEINHTGTLKLLNRPKVATSSIDYKGITNRAVYFSISAWWDSGMGHDPGGDGRKIFEGMSVGATVEATADREVVTLKLEDYMNALHGGKFVLSPYYDGMKAVNAVHDIVRQLGLSEDRILTGDTPVNQAANDPQGFGLPFTGFEAPEFRFPDGSSYKEAVLKIAQLDGKTVYFDSMGRFHYDPVPGGITGTQNFTPVAGFFSSPRQTDTMKHVCWNMTSFTRAINDTYNVIQVSTVDKITGDPIHVGDVNDAALHDPQAEGYLGYRKHLMIREPALGGFGPAAQYLATYRDKIFIPPLTVRMEIYGYSGLKPLDVITVDGTPLRVMNISSHISAQENIYWQNIEGEWFFGGAGKWQSPTLNVEADPSGTGGG